MQMAEKAKSPMRRDTTRRDTAQFDALDASRLRAEVAAAHARAHDRTGWFLESRSGDGPALLQTSLDSLPFRIGRASHLSFVVNSPHVSKEHAEIYARDGDLRLRDLGSTNGTFLNHEPIADAVLRNGDVLHFGDAEFRIVQAPPAAEPEEETVRTQAHRGPLSQHFGASSQDLRDLLRQEAVTMVFQPIVQVATQLPIAYEALGRGRHPSLPECPEALLDIAGTLGPEAQAELSRLFRRRAVELVRGRTDFPALFLNTHPAELARPGLLQSLEELRAFAPQVDLVLEIHESTLAHIDFITRLRNQLMEINVGLAYDDFGAGQARLLELAEVPPHYLKFDRAFVNGIDHGPTSRQRFVASLVAAARELRVTTVAEGVETQEEAAACVRAGFSHAQGYLFGSPKPIEAL
jgi:EAL domain-containing protein (putative c-di-GMP-specific phosphodiesterase class I)